MKSETKNSPPLRFSEFDEPWNEVSLGEIGWFKNGINKAAEEFGFGYPFVNLMDVFGKPALSPQELGLVNSSAKEREVYDLQKGDVLFIRSSVKREGVGETSVVLNDLKDTVYSGFLIRFRENTPVLDLDFKRYCFHTRRFRNNLISVSTSSANTNINQESLSDLLLWRPSVAEQQKISAFLSSLDEKILFLSKKRELLRKYKEGVMQQIFDRSVRFKDADDKDFPDWEESTLGDISQNVMYGLNSSAMSYDGQNGYIRITDIDEETRKFAPSPLTSPDGVLDEKYRVSNGDILFTRTGASVGKSYLYSETDGKLFFAGFLIRFSIINGEPYFVYIQTLRPTYDRWVRRMSMRSGQPGINAEEYKTLPVLLPCGKEQKLIADFITAIDHKIEFVSEQLDKTKVFRKSVFQQMFA